MSADALTESWRLAAEAWQQRAEAAESRLRAMTAPSEPVPDPVPKPRRQLCDCGTFHDSLDQEPS